MIVRFVRLPSNPDLPLPARQSAGAAGYDIASAEPEFVLCAGERRTVATGLRIELPPDLECQIRPRSGLALRHGIVVPNSPATIDPDYRGELQVLLWNSGAADVEVPRGMRIAQLVFARFVAPELRDVAELTESARGTAGFGSTGH